MADSGSQISGAERAAIFMMSLGEQMAAEVLKHMEPKEVQKVGSAMASLSNVPRGRVSEVLDKFRQVMHEQSPVGIGADDYVRKVLIAALGEEKASGVIDRVLNGKNSKGLDSLKWMDPRAVADVVRNEHPQIIAIVLSYLESDHAAEVLKNLPEASRSEVIMRVATLDSVPPAALAELNEVLEKQFSGASGAQSAGVGGVKTAAGIMNFIDGDLEAAINEAVTEKDAELAQQIMDQMFVFDNLLEIDGRGIQAILREVQSDNLIIALKGADEPVKNKIFSNMSARAAEMMREDLDAKGPVRLKDVEEAQKEVL
ncbi:MAG: flagellar motor switch protein FliG, partial [Gammaproteobacteria bacterium]